MHGYENLSIISNGSEWEKFKDKKTILRVKDFFPNFSGIYVGIVGAYNVNNLSEEAIPGGYLTFNGATMSIAFGISRMFVLGNTAFGYFNVQLVSGDIVFASCFANSYSLSEADVDFTGTIRGSAVLTQATFNISFSGYKTGSVDSEITGVGQIILSFGSVKIIGIALKFFGTTILPFKLNLVTGYGITSIPNSLLNLKLPLPYEVVEVGKQELCVTDAYKVAISESQLLTSLLYGMNSINLSIINFSEGNFFNYIITALLNNLTPIFATIPIPKCLNLPRLYGLIRRNESQDSRDKS